MTVKKIISESLIKMGQKDFVDNDQLSDEESELLSALLAALNIVYREVISSYMPLICSEQVTFVKGELDINNLQRRILYPLRIMRGEDTVSFKTYPNKIMASVSGAAVLEYAYMPAQQLTINSTIDDMRLTQSMLSDGTLAEYYFANKVFDLAKNYDTAFRSKLGVLRYKGKRLRLKLRRWN